MNSAGRRQKRRKYKMLDGTYFFECHCGGDENTLRFVLNKDLKTQGKDFYDFYLRARDQGVNYVKGKLEDVYEDPKTKNLKINYPEQQKLFLKFIKKKIKGSLNLLVHQTFLFFQVVQ